MRIQIRWRRFLALLGIILVLGAVAVVVLLPDITVGAHRVTSQQVRDAIHHALGPHVEYQEPDLAGVLETREISILGLVVRPTPESRPIVEAEEVKVRFDAWPILRMDSPRVTDVVFVRPTIRVRRNADGKLNMAELARAIVSYRETSQRDRPVAAPPRVVMQEGRLRVIDEAWMREPLVLEPLNLELSRVSLDTADDGSRLIRGRVNHETWGKWTFSAELELEDGAARFQQAHVEVERLQLQPDLQEMLHGVLGDAWQVLEPAGILNRLELRFTPHQEERLHATLEADRLRLGLLAQTIGEELTRVRATVQVRSDGVHFEASGHRGGDLAPSRPSSAAAEGETPFLEVDGYHAFLDLEGLEGEDDLDLPTSHRMHLRLAELQVDRHMRSTLTRLLAIGRRLQGGAGDTSDADVDRLLGENLAREIFDRYQVRGALGLDATVELPFHDGESPRFHGELSVREGSLVLPVAPPGGGLSSNLALDDLHGVIRFDGDNLTIPEEQEMIGRLEGAPLRLRGRVDNALEPGSRDYLVQVRFPELPLRADHDLWRKLRERAQAVASDGQLPRWWSSYETYQPAGTAEVQIRLIGNNAFEEEPRWDLTVLASGGMSFTYPGFPYSLQDVYGSLSLDKLADSARVSFELTGSHPSHPGASNIKLRGEVRGHGTPEEESEVFVRAESLVIDEMLYQALDVTRPEVVELLQDRLGVSGRATVLARLRRVPAPGTTERGPLLANIDIQLQQCSAGVTGHELGSGEGGLFEGFRYQVDDIHGLVQVRDHHVTIGALQGWTPDQELFTFSGAVDCEADGETSYDLELASESLNISPNLRKLLGTFSNRYVEIWDELSPGGHVQLRYRMTRDLEANRHVWVEVEPKGCTATAVQFPMPVRNIDGGSFRVVDGVVHINGLTAHSAQGRITLDGVIDPGGAGVDLKVDASDLVFTDELRQALPEGVRRVWQELQPSGSANVQATIAGQDAEHLDLTVAVDFLDVAASYRPLPVPLTNIRGRLRYGQSRILLEDLRADALGGRVAVVRGEVQGEGPSRTLNLQIKAQGLDLEHPEAGDLYERVADLREVLEPQGRVNLDCAVSLTGDELESIGARGTFTSDRFVFRDIVVQDLVARLALEEGILSIPSITGQIYGGDLDATFNLDTSSFGAYEGTLHIDGANANPFVEDVFGVSSARLRGVLHADLSFEGFGAGKENIRGAGTVSVTDGWLWEVPLFLGILDAVDPREARLEEARAFRECEARFRIQDGMLRFSRFVVDANTLRIIGRGDMDFAGALNLQVWTTAKEGLPIPVVGDVLSAAGGVLTVAVGTLVGFAVTGTYREPRLEVQPIKLVTDIMGHLLESAGADIPVEEP